MVTAMAEFSKIIGHEQIISHLQNAISMDKVSHAYILNGPEKSGKMMIAEAFAQTLEQSLVWSVSPASRQCAKISRISFM